MDENYLSDFEALLKREFPKYDFTFHKKSNDKNVFDLSMSELNFQDITIVVTSLIAAESGKTFCKKATEDIYEFIKKKIKHKIVRNVEMKPDERD